MLLVGVRHVEVDTERKREGRVWTGVNEKEKLSCVEQEVM